MENQNKDFLYDIVDGLVVKENEVHDDSDRFISLPDWNSTMGFQLMEGFVTSLRNPLFRETLREALSSGRGVFRNFKNALHDRPDIEKLWFRYKDREMRNLVVEWYNEYRETQGLGRIAINEEETTELVLSDFRVDRPESIDREILMKIDKDAFYEIHTDYEDSVIDLLYRRSRADVKIDRSNVLIAETPDASIAGMLWFDVRTTSTNARLAWILQLAVIPEYRGLGIGRALLDRFLDTANRTDLDYVFGEAVGPAVELSTILEAVGFDQHSATFSIDVNRWRIENQLA